MRLVQLLGLADKLRSRGGPNGLKTKRVFHGDKLASVKGVALDSLTFNSIFLDQVDYRSIETLDFKNFETNMRIVG